MQQNTCLIVFGFTAFSIKRFVFSFVPVHIARDKKIAYKYPYLTGICKCNISYDFGSCLMVCHPALSLKSSSVPKYVKMVRGAEAYYLLNHRLYF